MNSGTYYVARAKIRFGKIDYLNKGRKTCPADLVVELRHNGLVDKIVDGKTVRVPHLLELSFCGHIWNHLGTDCYSCGQNLDEMKKYLADDPLFMRLYGLWKKYHLNGLNAGTKKQAAMLEKAGIKGYDESVKYLKEHGLLVDKLGEDEELTYEGNGVTRDHYTYGHGWVHYAIPEDVRREIEQIIAEQQKKDGENAAKVA